MKSDAPPHANAPGKEPSSARSAIPPDEQLHRTLFDGLPGMAYLARADSSRTIELASAGGQTLLGFKPGQQPFQLAPLIHPDDREAVLAMIQSAVEENRAFAMEYRVRHANGDWRTVWEQGCPCNHGHFPAVQGQLLDVTQRIQREQARLSVEIGLMQTQKFHALNQLAGSVAHEFNNLIAGILGSAELVAMDMPENHPGRETLKQIFEVSNHARDFVHKLRALGQRLPPEFKPVRLQPIIEECLQILRTIIPAKVELRVQVNPDCPKVNADPAQIHQIILDLCLNAWQGLAERRGHITISLDNCPVVPPPAGAVSRLQSGPYVRLTVQDNSPGLAKAARDHIFQPFRHRRAGGSKIGLELFLVRETVQAHQGEIFLESEPGHGLTFQIYFPVAVPA